MGYNKVDWNIKKIVIQNIKFEFKVQISLSTWVPTTHLKTIGKS